MMSSPWYHLLYIGYLGYTFISLVCAESVYMDKWAHCQGDDINIDGDIYTIFATGGGFNHETLHCDITFKARRDKGLCLTFKKFSIEDCRVVLKIYERSTSSGSNRNMFKCHDSMPSRICTTERYFTVKLEKTALNNNKNYDFQIDVQESDSITEEGVFFMSIGLIAGIICAVIILIALMAALVICCCCKKKKSGKNSSAYKAAETTPPPPYPVRPSAPPLVDNPTVGVGHGLPPFTPPLYQPPPYSHHDPYAVHS
ncbi:hypothetical protein LOTGIDRAFT_238736 [Lottia gigantea]|uniref:CUB domain-containing protein n=1 Tax=Lottia gigantea TaxID=225164 RepID=V4CCV0_LOTGI|nr:hypothetical protein LOTGIDRAFT_238736 [Lottia gigantea]ESO99739.1 hypothetical protein LOTGIDRAFT_238736 [Lottia gigantea]